MVSYSWDPHSVGSGLFGVLLTGQTIASINNGLIWGIPPLLSDVWFPVSERATATAIGAAVAPQVSSVGLSLIPRLQDWSGNETVKVSLNSQTLNSGYLGLSID